MPETFTTTVSTVVDGQTYREDFTDSADSLFQSSPSVPAAKVGQLTTRTDNDTGVVTMVGGHGFITGNHIDLYWAGGSRRNMTATVSVNAVTLDAGHGDVLPANLTAVTAMKPTVITLQIDGDGVKGVAASAVYPGNVEFYDNAGTPNLLLGYSLAANEGKSWELATGEANLFAAATVQTVRFSHGDSTAAHTMQSVLVMDAA